MQRRRHVKHQSTLQDRISAWLNEVRAQADALAPGTDREALLKKVRQAETARHLNDLANSAALQPK
jgi:hypothetical protein